MLDPDGRCGAPLPTDEARAALAELVRLYDAEGAQELLDTMLQDLALQRPEFEQGLAQQDARRASRVVHTLKSTSAMLGASELSARFQALEARLRAGDFSSADDDARAAIQDYEARITHLLGLMTRV